MSLLDDLQKQVQAIPEETLRLLEQGDTTANSSSATSANIPDDDPLSTPPRYQFPDYSSDPRDPMPTEEESRKAVNEGNFEGSVRGWEAREGRRWSAWNTQRIAAEAADNSTEVASRPSFELPEQDEATPERPPLPATELLLDTELDKPPVVTLPDSDETGHTLLESSVSETIKEAEKPFAFQLPEQDEVYRALNGPSVLPEVEEENQLLGALSRSPLPVADADEVENALHAPPGLPDSDAENWQSHNAFAAGEWGQENRDLEEAELASDAEQLEPLLERIALAVEELVENARGESLREPARPEEPSQSRNRRNGSIDLFASSGRKNLHDLLAGTGDLLTTLGRS